MAMPFIYLQELTSPKMDLRRQEGAAAGLLRGWCYRAPTTHGDTLPPVQACVTSLVVAWLRR